MKHHILREVLVSVAAIMLMGWLVSDKPRGVQEYASRAIGIVGTAWIAVGFFKLFRAKIIEALGRWGFW